MSEKASRHAVKVQQAGYNFINGRQQFPFIITSLSPPQAENFAIWKRIVLNLAGFEGLDPELLAGEFGPPGPPAPTALGDIFNF